LFVFFVTIPAAAFINGMYYYFPVFVLYLFFVMLSQEKKMAGAEYPNLDKPEKNTQGTQ
jgi:hypothetical protein